MSGINSKYSVNRLLQRKVRICALIGLGALLLLGCVERAPRVLRLGIDLEEGEAGARSEGEGPARRGCARPSEGCPCRSGQPAVACGLETTEDEAGQTMCHEGTRFCRDSVWSACESVATFFAGPEQRVSAIVDSDCHVPCNVCAHGCYRVVDPLDPVQGGLTEDNSSCLKFATGGGIELINNHDPEAEGSGCFDDLLSGGGDGGMEDGGDPGLDGGVPDDGGEPDAAEPEQCVIEECQGKTYACGDCLDNDGDGLTDIDDPECLGACQNAEDTFAGEIPGGNAAPCKHDCYFDKDTGSGNDDCTWHHSCDPLEPENGCEFNPYVNIPGTPFGCLPLALFQSADCRDFCGPLTPPGCDYFGCCELPAHTGNYVWVGSEDDNGDPSCDSESVWNPERCHPCTPLGEPLFKPCGPCELCAGMTELPPECQSPSPVLPEVGTYSQVISLNECFGNQRPDWRDLYFDAQIPDGASLRFSACTKSALGSSCTPELLAVVTSAPDGINQHITSTVCGTSEECPGDASCEQGVCTYADQPVDVAESLSPGSNYLPYMEVEIELVAGPGESGSPILRDWMLSYVCGNYL